MLSYFIFPDPLDPKLMN